MSLLKLADDLMVSVGHEVMVIREKKYRGEINKNILELAAAGSYRPPHAGCRWAVGWPDDRGYGYAIGKPSTYGFMYVRNKLFKCKFVRGEHFKTHWGPSEYGEIRASPEREGQSKNYHQVIEDIDDLPPHLVEYMEEESTDSNSDSDSDDY